MALLALRAEQVARKVLSSCPGTSARETRWPWPFLSGLGCPPAHPVTAQRPADQWHAVLCKLPGAVDPVSSVPPRTLWLPSELTPTPGSQSRHFLPLLSTLRGNRPDTQEGAGLGLGPAALACSRGLQGAQGVGPANAEGKHKAALNRSKPAWSGEKCPRADLFSSFPNSCQ